MSASYRLCLHPRFSLQDVFEGGFCLFMKATKKENLIKFLEGNKDFIFRQALLNDRWMEDCQAEISFMAQMQCMHLCHVLATVNRNAAEQDVFTWMCSTSRQYLAKLVHSSLCNGWPMSPMAKRVWRSWAPLKCKLFVWLAMQYMIWM